MDKLSSKLDYIWVARWLDDIGLPQYKETFITAQIDGRLLNGLTVNDLLSMNITNHLHYLSIKRGIEALRNHSFDPNFMKRRAGPDEATIKEWMPSEIQLWSSHRVMEWLRSIDLSEFASNLRGSGVHGALICLEPLFNVNLISTLLGIPQNKTLLRRHLTTSFSKLIGHELVQQKRDAEAHANYIRLTPSTKLKPRQRNCFSSLRRRGKFDVDYDDLVCPLNQSKVVKESDV